MSPAHYNYLGIPGMLFYVLLLGAAHGLFFYSLFRRFSIFALLPAIHRFDRLPARVAHLVKVALLQQKIFKDSVAGPMHAIIFWGFCVVALNTMHLILRGFVPGFHLPLLGPGPIGSFYENMKDFFEIGVFCMTLFALYRRVIQRVPRLTQSTEANAILLCIWTLMWTDWFIGGIDHVMYQQGHHNHPLAVGLLSQAVGDRLAGLGLSAGSLVAIHQANWWLHMAVLFLMLNLLPLGKHFHIITSLPNVFLANLEAPGKFRRIDFEKAMADDASPEDMNFGVEKVTQYNWKQVLDFYSCTECGRCTAVCPAALSGKTLSPKHFNIYLRNHLYENNDFLVQQVLRKMKSDDASAKRDGGEPMPEKTVVEAWNEGYGKDHGMTLEQWKERQPGYEALWACTTCRNCEEACPLEITFVERFVELRRNYVLMEKGFPPELVRTFKGMEINSNPWNMDAAKRDAWTQGLEFEVPRMADAADRVEYLFYVGCAGSFDERSMKVTRATATILHKAGVRFGILGNEETCNGDSARRAGNEYLFNEMASALTETLNNYKVRKIVTNCPHCLNTLKNEYPDFGGRYEVIHSTVLVDALIREGKIKPAKAQNLTMAYHDSCYLGRYNGEYDAPRRILEALPGLRPREMPEFRREKSLCCGAGGARMWQEEPAGQRVNTVRMEQALRALDGRTEGSGVASNCPFCMTMMSDAAKAKNVDESLKTLDVMELVAGSLE